MRRLNNNKTPKNYDFGVLNKSEHNKCIWWKEIVKKSQQEPITFKFLKDMVFYEMKSYFYEYIYKDDCTKKEPDVTTKYEIVKRKTKSCHNTVKFSHWLFSNCNLDINQVTDIIDNISINNNADTILNLVVKYNIPTPNVKLFVSECKNFN